MRHKEPEPLVRSYAITHPVGDVHLPTQPGWDQVIYAASGLFVAKTETESWTVPPHRAFSVGDDTRVRVVTRRPTVMRCLYLRSEVFTARLDTRVVSTSPLLRELLIHIVERCPLKVDNRAERSLVDVVIERILAAPTTPLHLPMPTDDRCRQLAEILQTAPIATLIEAISAVPASRRTLERRFRAETGLSLGGWHRRSRILASIELLAASGSITEVAVACGYSSSSSFVAAFRSELGATPRKFLAS